MGSRKKTKKPRRLSEKQILQLLMDEGRPFMLTEMPLDSCIAASRISQRVLEHFGHRSWPIPVSVRLCNKILLDLLREKGGWPDSKEESQLWSEKGSYCVEAKQGTPGKGFDGHLILKTAGGMLGDLSLDQTSRPQHGIDIDNMVTQCPDGFPEALKHLHFETKDGVSLDYWVQDREPIWEDAPDWQVTRNDPMVLALIEMVQILSQENQ
jgi:hypothetical protein